MKWFVPFVALVGGSALGAIVDSAFGITFPSVWAELAHNLVYGLTLVLFVRMWHEAEEKKD